MRQLLNICILFLLLILGLPVVLLGEMTWMQKQIASDLEYYKKNSYSQENTEKLFQENKKTFALVKFQIKNNQIYYEAWENMEEEALSLRFKNVYNALKDVLQKYSLPNTTLLCQYKRYCA